MSTTETELEIISGGCTGLIKLRTDGVFVEKAPHANPDWLQESLQDLRREYAAYRRLPPHPRLLWLHADSTPERLVLPYLRKGSLHNFLRPSRFTSSGSAASLSSPPAPGWTIPPSQRLQFAADAAEGLSILHSVNIIHSDLNSWNFLVDDDFRLCIIDFSGSTIDGSPGSGFEGYRYRLPRSYDAPSTVRTDLFALGSVLYEIVTGEMPYERYEDQEVIQCFEQGVFPPTQDVLLGRIVLGCWKGAYESAEAVREDIVLEQSRISNSRDEEYLVGQVDGRVH